MLTKKQIEAFEAKGFSLWEGYDGSKRLYYNVEKAGLRVEYYKSGNVCNAWLNDEPISNNKARDMLAGKVYVSVATGELDYKNAYTFHYNAAKELYDEVMESVKAEDGPKTVRIPITEYKFRYSDKQKLDGSYDSGTKTVEVILDGEYVTIDQDPRYKAVRVSYRDYKEKYSDHPTVEDSYCSSDRTIELYIEAESEYIPVEKDPAYKLVWMPYCAYKERHQGQHTADYDEEEQTIGVYVKSDSKEVECSDDYEIKTMEYQDMMSGKWDAHKIPGKKYKDDAHPRRAVRCYLRKGSDYKLPERVPVKMLYKDYKESYACFRTDDDYSQRNGTITVYLPEGVTYERAEKDKHYEEKHAFRAGYTDEVEIVPDKIDVETVNNEIPDFLLN